MFVLAITLHNMPEGLAVGVGFGAADGMEGLGTALALMVAIGIQNIPEGLAVSVAAVNAGLDRKSYALFAGARAGAVEIPLAVLGAVAVQVVRPCSPTRWGSRRAQCCSSSATKSSQRPTPAATSGSPRWGRWPAS